jgi:hypothetical protein
LLNNVKEFMRATSELAKIEINLYLDFLFEELYIFKVITAASEIAKEKVKELGEGGKLAIMFLTKEILNVVLIDKFKFISSGLYSVVQKFLENQLIF